jgi:hypothetical protein
LRRRTASHRAGEYRFRNRIDRSSHPANLVVTRAGSGRGARGHLSSEALLNGHPPVIYQDIAWRIVVGETAQKRALRNYRSRLDERGISRFEVLGLAADRELIRSLAKRLAANDSEATRIRASIQRTVAGEPPQKGGILKALRNSPLVGAELDLERTREPGRDIDL